MDKYSASRSSPTHHTPRGGAAGANMDASGQQQADMADSSVTLPELTPQQVFEVISAAVGLDETPRRAAETTLKGWEADAAPGLFGSLLKIVQETSIDEVWLPIGGGEAYDAYISTTCTCFDIHILLEHASAGSSCGQERCGEQLEENHRESGVVTCLRIRKGIHTWCHCRAAVFRAERACCIAAGIAYGKHGQVCILCCEPGWMVHGHRNRHCNGHSAHPPTHRFDYPGKWPALLETLVTAAAVEYNMTSADGKMRALFALKHVLRTLRSKRFVVELPAAWSPEALGE